MKKGFVVLMSLVMTLFVCSCKFSGKLDVDAKSSDGILETSIPETATPQGGESDSGEQSQTLCTITGKALYSNSNDNSSIQMYIDKTEGVFSSAALNLFYGKTSNLSGFDTSRTIVSYKNCAKDGSYKFTDLQPGVYTIYAVSPDSQEKAVCKSITVTAGQTIEIPDLNLTATGSISGRITLNNSQNNNAGFVVFAAGTSFMAVTGSDGNFTISNVPANTNYEIIVMKGTYAFLWRTNIKAEPFDNTYIGECHFDSTISGINSTQVVGPEDVIHYVLDGGTLPEGAPLVHSYGTTTTLVEPVREGYTFLGYYSDTDRCKEKITVLDDSYVVGQNIYAEWILSKNEEIAALIDMTESGTFTVTSENLDSSYFADLKYTLTKLYKRSPEIKISLDFSNVASILFTNEQNFTDCTNIVEIIVSEAFLGQIQESWFDTNHSNYYYLFGNFNINVIISNLVQSVQEYAFRDCRKLKCVTIGEGVTSISDAAFTGCCRLLEVYDLSALNLTTEYFKDCNIRRIYHSLSESSDVIKTDDGYCYIITDEGAFFIGYIGPKSDLRLPEIFNYQGNTITSYKINGSAFYGDTLLTSIKIPDSVTSIGANAFRYCVNLDNVIIGESVEIIGDGAFQECIKIPAIEIPDSVTSIGTDAFKDCRDLNDLTIGESVEMIGDYAFYRCTGLYFLTIPDSVTSIGKRAFYNSGVYRVIMNGVWMVNGDQVPVTRFDPAQLLTDSYYGDYTWTRIQ